MVGRTLTIELPDDLYDRLYRRAAETQRSVAAEVVVLLATAVPTADDRLPVALEEELANIDAMDDASLWAIARARFPAQTAKRMQALQFKRQREGLNDAERQREVNLARDYDRHMLIRSKVILLLTQRGYNVDELVAHR